MLNYLQRLNLIWPFNASPCDSLLRLQDPRRNLNCPWSQEGTHFAISLPIIFNPNQNGENSCDMAPRPRGVEYSSLKILYFEVPLGFSPKVLLRDILAFIVKFLSFGQAKFKFCFSVLKIYVQRDQRVTLLRDLGPKF